MVYFSSRPSTDKVHTVQMVIKDVILAIFFSDLASNIFELLASLKILIPPLVVVSQVSEHEDVATMC
jgi:hypothetical protein